MYNVPHRTHAQLLKDSQEIINQLDRLLKNPAKFNSPDQLIEKAIGNVIGGNNKFPTLYNENEFTKLVRPMLAEYLGKAIKNPADRGQIKDEFDKLILGQKWGNKAKAEVISAADDALKFMIQEKYANKNGAAIIGNGR